MNNEEIIDMQWRNKKWEPQNNLNTYTITHVIFIYKNPSKTKQLENMKPPVINLLRNDDYLIDTNKRLRINTQIIYNPPIS